MLQDEAEVLDGRQTQFLLERRHDILYRSRYRSREFNYELFLWITFADETNLVAKRSSFVLLLLSLPAPLQLLIIGRITYRNSCGGVVLEGLCLSVLEEHLQHIRHGRYTQVAQREGRWLHGKQETG